MILTGRGKKQAHLKVTWVVPKSIFSYSTKVLALLTNIPIAYTINTCCHGGGAHIRFRFTVRYKCGRGSPNNH
jgi:hypothetical protein